jgi:hypothetical protein
MFSHTKDVFGYTQYKKLNIGDLVSWSELGEYNKIVSPEKIKKFGIISQLLIVHRGDRKVAVAKVIPLNDSQREKEVLVISLEIVNKTKESLVL